MATYTSQPDDTIGIDAFIEADTPTTNYGNDSQFLVGKYASTSQVYRGLIKFDFSSIPATALITSATLTLTIGYAYNNTQVDVYRIKRAWVEGQATWNIYSTGNNWQVAGALGANDYDSTSIGNGTPSAAGVGTALDISLTTSYVQELINGTMTNNGFLIKSSEASNSLNGFVSSSHATSLYRPKLVIEYTLPSGNHFWWS